MYSEVYFVLYFQLTTFPGERTPPGSLTGILFSWHLPSSLVCNPRQVDQNPLLMILAIFFGMLSSSSWPAYSSHDTCHLLWHVILVKLTGILFSWHLPSSLVCYPRQVDWHPLLMTLAIFFGRLSSSSWLASNSHDTCHLLWHVILVKLTGILFSWHLSSSLVRYPHQVDQHTLLMTLAIFFGILSPSRLPVSSSHDTCHLFWYVILMIPLLMILCLASSSHDTCHLLWYVILIKLTSILFYWHLPSFLYATAFR